MTEAAVDLLTEVVAGLRPELGRQRPIKDRVATFWAFVVEAEDTAATDVITEDFLQLALETGLVADAGRHGREDIQHVISWGLRGLNPFARGPLR